MPRLIVPVIIIIGVVIFQSLFIVQEIIQSILDESTVEFKLHKYKRKKQIHQIK